jgi:hypothetical protein
VTPMRMMPTVSSEHRGSASRRHVPLQRMDGGKERGLKARRVWDAKDREERRTAWGERGVCWADD